MAVLEKKRVRVDKKSPSLQRIESRCINCGLCMKVCEEIAGLDHAYEKDNKPLCINCGQCIMNCPVGALLPKYHYKKVLNLLNDTNKIVVLSVAPAVRVSLASEFGIEDGTNLESIIPSIAKHLGFDYVFDISFGADVTIMEEANELLKRLNEKKNLPMYTSCCPSWVKYASMFHPELLPNISTTKSPIGIQSTLIKTYFKELNNIDKDIISVVVAPCTSKKYEILNEDTDYIITTQEFAMMIRECEIEVDSEKPSCFDSILGKGSLSGLMFGRSGGVMESTLNYLYYLITKKIAPTNYFNLQLSSPIIKKCFKIGRKTINIAVIYGMANLEAFLKEADSFDFVEVMSCPNGCVGGGGQPLIAIPNLDTNRKKRVVALNNSLYSELYCFQNKEILELYNYYLDEPLSEKAIELLHTKYKDLSYLIKK